MSYYKDVYLTCDGENCIQTYGKHIFIPTATRARHRAKGDGWTCRSGEDYCPECK